jgi:hypothetical protein
MISRRASARYATDATIHYHDAAQGYETFDERFTRQESIGAGRGRTSMVEPRARIAVGTLTYWINRGDSDWTLSATEAPLSGGGVTLPTNGWLVLDSSDGAIFGSFEADFTGGTRVDVGYVPGEFTLVDGRGTELTAFGVTSSSGRLALEHYSGDFTLAEDGSQEVQRTALTVAAATVEQDTEVAMPYLEHQTASASPEHVTSAYSTSPSA